jgi:hypothetical protein
MKMRAATSAIRPEAAAQPDGIGPWPSYRAFRRVARKKADPAKTTIVPRSKKALTALAVGLVSSKSERGTRGIPESVMAGPVPAIHVFSKLKWGEKMRRAQGVVMQALRPEENMSRSRRSRRGVDGRDKPGHDEGSVQGGPPKRVTARDRDKEAE